MKTTVVIADSDIVLLELLRSRCIFMGLCVETATRGDDALRAIGHLRPQLVCVSQELTCADGRTVCEALARDEQLAQIPTIVLADKRDERGAAASRALFAYVVPRSGNLWHRIEPLIYELTDMPLHDAEEAERRFESLPTWRIDEPRATREEELEEFEHQDMELAADVETDDRESVLEAVFAWFGSNEEATDADEVYAAADGPHAFDADAEEPPWVLCIEDDLDFSMALKLRLEAHGVAVVRAFDGTAGYRAAFTHPASAILLDYNLPQGQGDYVLRRLKENPVTADVPVIVLTGNRSTATRRQMFNLGADAYLTKPLDFSELLEVLGAYVDLLPAEYAAESASGVLV